MIPTEIPGATFDDEGNLVSMSEELMGRYIYWTRQHIKPQMTEATARKLARAYSDLRAEASAGLTTRFNDVLRRLSTAYARLEQSPTIEPRHAEQAYETFVSSMKLCGVDPETGGIDWGLTERNETTSQHDRIRIVQSAIKFLVGTNGQGYATYDEIIQKVASQGLTAEQTMKALETLKRNNSIYPKGGEGTAAPLQL